MLVLPLLFFIPVVIAQGCEPGWRMFQRMCYKHFMSYGDRVSYDKGEQRCNDLGGHLATVSSHNELIFIGDLVRTPGMIFGWSGMPLVGAIKGPNGQWFYNWSEPSQPYIAGFCDGKPNDYQNKENCLVIVTDHVVNTEDSFERLPGPPCLDDALCAGDYNGNSGFLRYVCKRPQGKICPANYIDITETDVPERKKYKKGEKCFPKDPCREVEDLTVNYIIDSSQSIGKDNWKSLVKFLQSGADFLPNKTRVGFIKYSENITFADFLEPVWSKSKFKKFVPDDYDSGETNTPVALEKARKMFKDDESRHQVAVLITDGLPFSSEEESQEKMNEITKKAAKKLQSGGVNLIALGYGKDLTGANVKVIKSWLEDPEEDYFEYDRLACDLKSVHMSILMRKVCRRFVKY